MSLANLLAWSLQSAVLVLAGGALARATRVRDPRVMLRYWQALLVVVLLLPLLQPWRHAGSIPAAVAEVVLTPVFGGSARIRLDQLIGFGLVAGSLLCGLRLCLGLGRLRGYRERLLLDLPAAVREQQARLGVDAMFYVCDELSGPVTFGCRRPAVILPSAFLEMPPEQQRAIACHELLHVRRRDWAMTLGEECLRAALWFHPAIRWLIGWIRAAREQCVDREVVALTGARQAYLEALLEIARLGIRRASLAPPFLGESHLRDRVELLLKEVLMTRARVMTSLALSAAALTLAGAAAAWAFPIRALERSGVIAAGSDKGAGPSTKKAGKPPRLLHQVNPVYPPQAKQDGIAGLVTLEIRIEKSGEVSEVRVLKGREPLSQAAVAAVRQWRYAASDAGPMLAQIGIEFRLDEKDEKKQ